MPGRRAALAAAALATAAARQSAPATTTTTCVDEDGTPVDWWVAMKYPLAASSAAGGVAYSWLSSASTAFQASAHDVTSTESLPARQLEGVYKGDTLAHIFYNDQWPNGSWTENFGHSKGALVWDESSGLGFWVQHSVPDFPNYVDDGYEYGEGQERSRGRAGTSFVRPLFSPRRRRDPVPRGLRRGRGGAASRPNSRRRGRGGVDESRAAPYVPATLAPPTIRLGAAASPRVVCGVAASRPNSRREPGPVRPSDACASDDPTRSRGGAATPLHGIATSRPRRRRDSSPRNIRASGSVGPASFEEDDARGPTPRRTRSPPRRYGQHLSCWSLEAGDVDSLAYAMRFSGPWIYDSSVNSTAGNVSALLDGDTFYSKNETAPAAAPNSPVSGTRPVSDDPSPGLPVSWTNCLGRPASADYSRSRGAAAPRRRQTNPSPRTIRVAAAAP